ncbi:MAG TPA: CAP domain-containing protein [Leptolyngbyaceae cyanobacterium]
MVKRSQVIFVMVAIGFSLGVATISTGLTKTALPSATSKKEKIYNYPISLVKSLNKTVILATHNQYRREIGIASLQWSENLANSAQTWANHLASINSMRHSSTRYGENLWSGTPNAYSQIEMVNAWGEQKKYFIPNRPVPHTCQGGWHRCGHYTQIIWKNTTQVGCGLARGRQRDYLVCQYNPPGNFVGQKPF